MGSFDRELWFANVMPLEVDGVDPEVISGCACLVAAWADGAVVILNDTALPCANLLGCGSGLLLGFSARVSPKGLDVVNRRTAIDE
jgi:hypothetical protein